jgi:cytochrome c peroxidase
MRVQRRAVWWAGLALAACLAVIVSARAVSQASGATSSSDGAAELTMLRSLWIGSLSPPPDDPSNAYDTDPRAARLGRALFFDTRLSANGAVACGTCHLPDLAFQDGRPRGRGIADVPRRTMPLLGVAHQTWFFWDGRKDSLWAQALGPPESPAEHGISRTRVAVLIREHYREAYETIFGSLPVLPPGLPEYARPADDDPEARRAWEAVPETARDAITRVYVDIGKAIAAFERTIQPGPAPFDHYIQARLRGEAGAAARAVSAAAIRGFRLFVGKARCTNCHAGPLLTNGEFHATLVPPVDGQSPDPGRGDGLPKVLADEFNCRSRWSDAQPAQCTALRFVNRDAEAAARAFKTPTLRNVAARAPYMHAGQLRTLPEVLRFYRDVGKRVRDVGHGGLSDAELVDLQAFLESLTGPVYALDETASAAASSKRSKTDPRRKVAP